RSGSICPSVPHSGTIYATKTLPSGAKKTHPSFPLSRRERGQGVRTRLLEGRIGSFLGLIDVVHLEVFELVVPKDRGADLDAARVHVAEFARNPGHDPIHRVGFGDEQTFVPRLPVMRLVAHLDTYSGAPCMIEKTDESSVAGHQM